jgi:hypothetical protein
LRIPDDDKRDIYSVEEVVQVLERHAPETAAAEAHHV